MNNYQTVINTEGLEEEIRCLICTNPNHTDKGCDGNCSYNEKIYKNVVRAVENRLKKIPTDEDKFNEWCTDCKEYDHERHCCPRFNRVIQETVKEIKNDQWTPMSDRPPEDGTKCLVTQRFGNVRIVSDATYSSDLYRVNKYDFIDRKGMAGFYNHDSEIGYIELENVIAWMPKPKAWEGDF